MKLFKYSLALFLFVAVTGGAQVITAQNAEIGAGTTPAVSEEAASEEDLRSVILAKIELVKDLLKQADEAYEEGNYDLGYENAVKAKALTDEINGMRTELYNRVMAQNKIDEAKKLISQAENLEGGRFAADELASAKAALLSAESSFSQKDFANALSYAEQAVNYAQACLNKIEEVKTREMGGTQVIKMDQQGIQDTGEYKIRTTYTVRYIPERRDCLWRIAEYDSIYSNPWKWPILYKANKRIIRDPDLIFPGQVLAIPELDEKGNPVLLEKGAGPETSEKVPSEIQTPANEKGEADNQ